MSKINKDLIKIAIADEFVENVSQLDEMEIYRLTQGISERELRIANVMFVMLMKWIRKVNESENEKATPEFKVQAIQEILDCTDTYLNS
ncbi:hypothetical protein [Clostridium beijerinckii]|uniref:Uncharacterized protein n=1 Tax=Clostridium beijerinckii TaxID=1520 RepID=A0AAE5LNW5_CLOBE|nr:hypothetical protein [Clostridium beijerinckii]ALB44595.1 hypothetical protein X276_04505 [Clostridium beijerinckii NRRL B-598]NSB13031.1 hypothetical protein [Clostridium beijerinckii]OOM22133.1 hypothetical protein CLOBE_44720 [Clostridium beijerinckii]